MKEVTLGPCRLICADCLDVLPTLEGVDCVITDPPYGCNKATWDSVFPTEWYRVLPDIPIVTITGSAGLKDSMNLVGEEFIDVISGRNLNGMTRGPLGFGNWLAAVVSRKKVRQGTNAFEFSVSGEMPEHPSPKPISFMVWIVNRCGERNQTVLDPFMGSGTTGIACIRTGRKFIGIEKSPEYFEIACDRIRRELQQLTLPL